MDMAFIDSQPLGACDSGQALRPLGWSEFCARLSAAQAARRVLGQDVVKEGSRADRLSGGSFYYPAAALLQQPLCDDERAVNPILSANGKCDGSKDAWQVAGFGDSADRSLTQRELP